MMILRMNAWENCLRKSFERIVDSDCLKDFLRRCFRELLTIVVLMVVWKSCSKESLKEWFLQNLLKWLLTTVVWEICLRELFTMIVWWFLERMFWRVVESFVARVIWEVSMVSTSIVQIRFSGTFFQVFYRKLFFEVVF